MIRFCVAPVLGCVLALLCGCSATTSRITPFDDSRVKLLQLEPLVEGENIAVLMTDSGEIRMRFFPSEAPNAVDNFILLANEGFYDGKRIYPPDESLGNSANVLLSGGAAEISQGISRIVGGPFREEISANLWHFAGAVSILGNGSGKGDSRFFITGSHSVPESFFREMKKARYPKAVLNAFRQLGGSPEFSLEYSVFAQVVQGQEVVDDLIVRLTKESDLPVIQEVTIQEYTNEEPSELAS